MKDFEAFEDFEDFSNFIWKLHSFLIIQKILL